MARIVLATFGSLGDLHPIIALGLELQQRGHSVAFATTEFYREKLASVGLEFFPLRPDINAGERQNATEIMDTKTGTKTYITEMLFPHIRSMFDDLMEAVKGADLLISGEIIFAARSVVEKTGIKWVTFGIIPISILSAYDPPVFPMALWLERFRFLPAAFHQSLYWYMRRKVGHWLIPYKKFRREIGLSEDHDPLYLGKYSDQLHLALFSKLISPQQRDWPKAAIQPGFSIYHGKNYLGKMPDGLEEFLEAGGPPIVFTLGTFAVMDAGDFFEQSIAAAKLLKKRAIIIYGSNVEPPEGLDENIIGVEFAPFDRILSSAAAIVFQGGMSTISHVLYAGVPMLIVPDAYYDRPDNAARCRRLGVARILFRDKYNAENAARELGQLLSDPSYRTKAQQVKNMIEHENGTRTASEAIEALLEK